MLRASACQAINGISIARVIHLLIRRITNNKTVQNPNQKYRKWLLDKSHWLLQQDITATDCFALIEKLPGLCEVRNRVAMHADSETVLLYRGPKGSGKTTIAKYAHHLSKRRNRQIVSVNCSSIPHELFEQYLFGRRKGSSTGASYEIPGYFAEARDSTLFLDEVGDLPLLQQAKLLIAIEEGRYRKIGELHDDFSNARTTCATNRDLEQMVQDGTMRDDFYSRIDDVVIDIPPLADRREDILHYVQYFLHESAKVRRIECPTVEPGALELLLFHDWSDEDVRGIRKIIRQAIYEFTGSISADLIRYLLKSKRSGSEQLLGFFEARRRWERQHISSAIITANGDDAVATGLLHLTTKRQLTRLKQRNGIKNRDILS